MAGDDHHQLGDQAGHHGQEAGSQTDYGKSSTDPFGRKVEGHYVFVVVPLLEGSIDQGGEEAISQSADEEQRKRGEEFQGTREGTHEEGQKTQGTAT